MKRIALTLLVINAFYNYSISYAFNNRDTEYHCPSFSDIKYENGQFSASTLYNNIEMTWYSIDLYPEAKVNVSEFELTNSMNDCIGGTCKIYCVYKVNSKRETLKLFVSRQEYRLVNEMNGPWKDHICSSSAPEDCTFTVVKHR